MRACLEMIDRLGKFISMNVFSTRVNGERETEETRSRREQRQSGRNVWFTSTSMWMKTMKVCVSRSERFFPTWQHTCILVQKKKKTLNSNHAWYTRAHFQGMFKEHAPVPAVWSSTADHELSWEGTTLRKYFSHWIAGSEILSTDRNRTVY